MNPVYKCGNEALLKCRKTAFLCSRQTPDGVRQAVETWLDTLKKETDCVMCGDQSAVERIVFAGLLKREIPVILVLARTMPTAWSVELQTAMHDGRMLAITHCDTSVHLVNARSAGDRNLLMIGLADEVVVGFCTQGGNLWRQLANTRGVRYLFQNTRQGTTPSNGGVGMTNEPQPMRFKPVATPWHRRMWAVNGAVTIERECVSENAIFKIWQVKDFELNGGCDSSIILSAAELTDFHEALGEVIIHVGARHIADVRTTEVKTNSGTVMFDFKMLTADGVLVISQKSGSRFVNAQHSPIMINAREIRTFYEKITEAKDVATGGSA